MLGIPAPDPGSFENPSLTDILMGGYTVPYLWVSASNAIKGLATGAAAGPAGIFAIPATMFDPHTNPYLYSSSPD